jgi:hypothetical protein
MTNNLIMGIPTKKLRSGDPYSGREVLVLEANEGLNSSNRIRISNELVNRLDLSEDSTFLNLAVITDKDDNTKILSVNLVISTEGYRVTKRNGLKPRSMSDKKLHAFLLQTLFNQSGELSQDKVISFTILTGSDKPAELSNYSWVLRLNPITTESDNNVETATRSEDPHESRATIAFSIEEEEEVDEPFI